ncbi:unnamed protein product [Peronospora destructor]|uniref:ABC-2 type transporter transmembrane domain-containing protein n=1 Tax=Peronospora destructor TaxID=86335 RepID=A0AAV0T6W4_9STRA|nr:unnamed protein product [Peronospora destructor]
MLEVIGAGVGHDAGPTDFVDVFKKSEEKRILDADLAQEGVTIPSPNYPEMVFTQKRAASSWTQARFLVGRFMNMYWRTPSYNLTRFIVTFLLALVFGLLFLNGDYQTYQGINGGVGTSSQISGVLCSAPNEQRFYRVACSRSPLTSCNQEPKRFRKDELEKSEMTVSTEKLF